MRTFLTLAFLLPGTAILAQTEVTVSTGPANAQQVWYSLQNGVQATADLAAWDLAFEINSFTSSILVNTAKGLTVFETPLAIADWASLTSPNEADWTAIYNSELSWFEGALTNGNNLDQPDGFNLGWGGYSFITHTVAGTKVYVIKDGEGNYRKLRINSLASNTYSFTFADLDGSNEITATLNKSNFVGKNFGYFSFDTNSTADLEPAANSWDLLFTKYTSIIPAPEPTAYSVAGVLQNKQVDVAQVDGIPVAAAQWEGQLLDSAMNIIGYDWKTFNMTTFSYEYAEDRTYFVNDRQGNIWKLVFIGYGGSSTGTMTFTQELVSATSVDELDATTLSVFPVPVNNGVLNIAADADMRNATLEVIDASGRTLHSTTLTDLLAGTIATVDMSDVPSGMYVVRLQAPGTLRTARVVVE
ncbi:MAG: T9SS type A sorting domain-containing protein [Flavobacteriales bacterium]